MIVEARSERPLPESPASCSESALPMASIAQKTPKSARQILNCKPEIKDIMSKYLYLRFFQPNRSVFVWFFRIEWKRRGLGCLAGVAAKESKDKASCVHANEENVLKGMTFSEVADVS